jgi:hypothetical protein
VLLLAGLGLYLFLPKSSPGASAQSRPGQTGSGQTGSGQTGSGQTGSGQASHSSVSPTPTSLASSPTSAGKAPDIYSWLPFTPSGLASAARITTTFAADYGTYSYRQDTASYLAPMKPLITSQLADLLGRAYSAPGVISARNSGKQVSVGSAVVTALRAFGPSSITFVVTLTERTNGKSGPGSQSAQYAITVTGAASSWQVNNIEPADAGNQ